MATDASDSESRLEANNDIDDPAFGIQTHRNRREKTCEAHLRSPSRIRRMRGPFNASSVLAINSFIYPEILNAKRRMSPGLLRAKNALFGGALLAFVARVFAYALAAVKQDTFNDLYDTARL
ncbi:hypothetical protein FB451DRAFT_1410420 [Mycena latifolia]|nr:hypothetical protein FB451DRAFT_1410420 [Mycena latifolia]